MTIRFDRSPFFWFLLVVAALELCTFVTLPYRDHPQAAQVNRNPTPLRAWPEYLSGDSPADKDLVVLISTSQGLGLELPDDREIFFSGLRRRLAATHPDIVLENWSIAGLRTDQLELLSLQAAERRASLVVFLLSLGNIDEEWRFRLDVDAADLDLLAGDINLWPWMSDTALFGRTPYHDFLLRALLLNSSLGRSRIAVLDAVAERLPRERHRAVFGAVRPVNARLTIPARLQQQDDPIRFNSLFSRGPSRPAEYFERQYRRRRMPVFDAIYPGMQERFEHAGIDAVWIWTPLAAKGFQDTLLTGAAPLHREICRRMESDGWTCLDKTRALPLDHFLVGDIASHLNKKGHEALARILTPIVADAVH